MNESFPSLTRLILSPGISSKMITKLFMQFFDHTGIWDLLYRLLDIRFPQNQIPKSQPSRIDTWVSKSNECKQHA